MNLFSKLFRSRDKPKNYLSTAFTFLFGPTSSGNVVTERTAMQTTAVYACVRVLSEAIAGLPLNLYRYTPDGGKEKAINHPLYNLLHDAPNLEMTSFIFRETLMSHLLLWGNAYAQIIRNGTGQPIALYPLLPSKMDVSRAANGQLIYTYSKDSDEFGADNRCQQIVLSQDEVLHVPGLGFDGLIGYSPIAMAKNAIGMSAGRRAVRRVILCQRCYTGRYPGASRHREGSGQAVGKLACPIFRHEPAQCSRVGGRHDLPAAIHSAGSGAVP